MFKNVHLVCILNWIHWSSLIIQFSLSFLCIMESVLLNSDFIWYRLYIRRAFCVSVLVCCLYIFYSFSSLSLTLWFLLPKYNIILTAVRNVHTNFPLHSTSFAVLTCSTKLISLVVQYGNCTPGSMACAVWTFSAASWIVFLASVERWNRVSGVLKCNSVCSCYVAQQYNRARRRGSYWIWGRTVQTHC